MAAEELLAPWTLPPHIGLGDQPGESMAPAPSDRGSGRCFRPSRRRILANDGPFLLAPPVLLFLWVLLRETSLLVMAALLAGADLLLLWRSTLPRFRGWIHVDGSALKARMPSGELEVRWPEVVVARRHSDQDVPGVLIATDERSLWISLKDYPEEDVWGEIRDRVPASSLSPDAHARVPEVQARYRRRDEILEGEIVTVRDSSVLRAVAWLGFPLFLAIAVVSGVTGVIGGLLVGGAFALATGWLVVRVGATTLTREGIERRELRGAYRIRWPEITSVEISPDGDAIALHGRSKCLTIPGPLYWSASRREDMIVALSAHLERHHLRVTESRMAAWRRTRGTKARAVGGFGSRPGLGDGG